MKVVGYWTTWQSSFRSPTQKPWKVVILPRSWSGNCLRIRFFISAAALLVKVTQRILAVEMPSISTRYIYRAVSVLVLPEPAPATTRMYPSVVTAASYCWGFNSRK